jgi:MYXO-CTERM domain-containing protein
MTVSHQLRVYALSASLLFGFTGVAFAQSAPANTNTTPPAASGKTAGSTSSATNGSGSSMNNAGGDTDNRGHDWGWLGLIGLVGLAGLMKRDRNYAGDSRMSTASR